MRYRKKKGPDIWVVRCERGFSITAEGNRQHLIPPGTQSVAIAVARLLAHLNGSELVVQSRQGRIRAKDSHGADSPQRRG